VLNALERLFNGRSAQPQRPLSVGRFAIEDAFDLEGVAVVAEEDAVILRAEP
jgi:hypothetical protein